MQFQCYYQLKVLSLTRKLYYLIIIIIVIIAVIVVTTTTTIAMVCINALGTFNLKAIMNYYL